MSWHGTRMFMIVTKHLLLNIVRLSGNKETREILTETRAGQAVVAVVRKISKYDDNDGVSSPTQLKSISSQKSMNK